MTKPNKTENFHLMHKIQKQYENWKLKAVTYNRKICVLSKRLTEIIKSRDKWRAKYYDERAAHNQLKKEMAERENSPFEKVANHSYPLEIILFAIWLRSSSSVSLGGVKKVLEVFNRVFDFNYEIPCRETIRTWEKKHSLHRLEVIKENIEGEWAVIIDESITIGEEKILLVLGVPLSKYEFKEALKFTDIKVVQISISKSWKAVEVSSVLNDLLSIGYDIKYVVSDGCKTLKCAIKNSDLERVPDCTHAFGNILKSEYEKVEEYQSFDKDCNLLKKQTNLGVNAVISPPKYRAKGKFLNLWEKAKWSNSMLKIMELQPHQRSKILSDSMQDRLSFITKYKSLIKCLFLRCDVINDLHKILKNKGLSEVTIQKCREILESKYEQKMKIIQSNFELKTDNFGQKIETYFIEGLALLEKLDLPKIICTSDIIESMFGKYKERVRKGSSSVTDDCLNIANFTEEFSRIETKKAMEEVKIVDIIKWRKENCKDSLRAKKQKMYKNVG